MNRRGFLSAILAAACAPAIAKSQSLMKIYVPKNDIIVPDDYIDFSGDFNIGKEDFTVESFIQINSDWQHVSVIKTGQRLQGYQDGVAKSPKDFQKIWSVARDPMAIHSNGLIKPSGKPLIFNGRVDELKIMNIATTVSLVDVRKHRHQNSNDCGFKLFL